MSSVLQNKLTLGQGEQSRAFKTVPSRTTRKWTVSIRDYLSHNVKMPAVGMGSWKDPLIRNSSCLSFPVGFCWITVSSWLEGYLSVVTCPLQRGTALPTLKQELQLAAAAGLPSSLLPGVLGACLDGLLLSVLTFASYILTKSPCSRLKVRL